MRKLCWAMIATATLSAAIPARAQEVVVTGQYRGGVLSEGYSSPQQAQLLPIVTMRRTADYAVQKVRVVGDTRDAAKRHDEVYAMVKNAIELAGKAGVELSTGDLVLEPLTLASYRNLTLGNAGRTDTDQAVFLVKARLAPGMDARAALERISKFVAAVPNAGRAEIETIDSLSLSVVNPNQYRDAIVDMIAADAAKTAARFGPSYAVQATGLDRPVLWARAGLIDVFLYLPASYVVVPKQ